MAGEIPLPPSDLAGATGAWEWDLAGDRVRGDARFANLLSLEASTAADGVSGHTFFEGVHPDDRLRLRIAVAGVAYGAEVFAREFRLGDDGARWISARGRAEHDAEGKPVRFHGLLSDITEQKRLEERLRIAQSAGGVGTFEYVEGFGTVTVSDQFCGLLGLQRAEALPVRTINNLVHPDDAPIITTDSAETATRQVELRIRRADTGLERWLAVRGEQRRLPDAGVSFIGVIYDITESKQAEADLQDLARTLEERVEARTQERDRLWNASRDLFAVVGRDGLYKSVNPAWQAMLGYDQADLIGRSFREFVHPQDRDMADGRWLERSRGAALPDQDLRILAKDGAAHLINWTVIPLEEDIYAIGRDVTERKELEEQLRQSQKMEAVGQLTGGIAHDFNNMLTGVIGGLDMLRRRLADGRLDEANRFIDAASQSAERAAALTHRLLAFSRRQSLEQQPIDANILVASMEDLLQRTLGEGVDVGIVLQADLWPALSDANQLESALLNLAINARDAMPDGGKLTIETSNTHLDQRVAATIPGLQAGDFILISVSDTGSGMDPTVVSRAFDPFYTTKPLGQGTGLGLSMVYGFARQSGGHVAIYSEPAVGTTVKLYLPRLPGEVLQALPSAATQASPEGAGETVLVVEDDAAVRMVIVELLRELGYVTIELGEADSALPLLASSKRIDLLISDVGLPGLNGRQLADMARVTRPQLPVLFITGYASGAARRSEFLGSGMEMITKPFAVEALALKVREMLLL